MDDLKLYGEEIYRIGFGEAVERDLLADYKVLILTLSDKDVPPAIQKMISDKENKINSDDASKLIGCINALSKQVLGDEGILKASDPEPMRRAVAFCSNIEVSKNITATYNNATNAYISSLPPEKKEQMVSIASKHIDGTMSAPERDELLGWLKAETKNDECRVLTNVRCLSEGVDVPSLDAVMFLSARNSQVDVVQSVGRVMRKAEGKKYGYIIIPVIIPSDIEADKGLDDNAHYKVVWTVLNALRAHDDRFNAIVNKIELNKNRPAQILVGRPETSFENGEAISANSDKLNERNKDITRQMVLQFEQLQNIIFARMVQKVGDRRYWEQWAKSVAEIASRQVERINRLITEDETHHKAFADFLSGLQKNINPSITQTEAVDMLSQHIITKPVFEALFEGYSFVKNNPISISMQTMLDLLEHQAFDKDAETLQKFYESVKMRASGIDNAEGKQRIIIELYDKFFKTAFPKMVEKLGIVYTPIEVVDFIIHSVNDVLKHEFDRSISDENIHILDPFTGTGTFITRLLQSGLINKADLMRKYACEIHANEIVLLAYYIAAVNIENAYHDIMGDASYTPFEGICLTDTFQLGEKEGSEQLFTDMFPQNSKRVQAQKKAPLRVIMGNPPYSKGQKLANDNAQNQEYEKLNGRIASTYAAKTKSTNINSLYNSYLKAFRWSADRLDPENGGVIAFITNNGWLGDASTGKSADGFRKCLEEEFSSIYVFNLRGGVNGRSGESARKEGQNVFNIVNGVAITILVKKPNNKDKATIYYHDIGDYLNRKEKLSIITKLASANNAAMEWQIITPNEHGDWLSHRNKGFEAFIPLGDKDNKTNRETFFVPLYSNGLKTQRDAWCYNSNKVLLNEKIITTTNFYNDQRIIFNEQKRNNKDANIQKSVDFQSTKISWTRALLWDAEKNKELVFDAEKTRQSIYRPFFKQYLYFDKSLNEMVYQLPKLFPTATTKNIVIGVATDLRKNYSVLIANVIPDLGFNAACQCFPLYYYEEQQKQNRSLFDDDCDKDYIRRDGVSDFILERAKAMYGAMLNKEDIFYYVYGLLHSPQYRTAFANDLKKMLPRLPLVEDVRDFWAFSKAGRALADLHINYESVPAYDGVNVIGAESGFFAVEKMRFPKKGEKHTIHFNSKITISNIPAKAYDYVVNGKSAIEWIMERYAITTHKDSGITNNPNDWASEVGNPRYILDLLLSIINVSVQTVDIVATLPKLSFNG